MANIEIHTATETVAKTETTTIIPQQNNTPILLLCCGSFLAIGLFLGGQFNRPPPGNGNGITISGNANNVKILRSDRQVTPDVKSLPKIAPIKNAEGFVFASYGVDEEKALKTATNESMVATATTKTDCVSNQSKNFDLDVAEQICKIKERRRKLK